MNRWIGALMVLALSAATPVLAVAAGVRIDSETIFRWYEREDSAGEEQNVLPLYEYLRLDMGRLDEKGLSFHAYGWGRYDFGDDFFENSSESEILYGYLQYTLDQYNLTAWGGRNYVFEGISNLSVDGVGGRTDLGQWFSASAYVGQPVELSGTDGRDGDLTFGGRFSHHLGNHYEVGLSYKRVDNDSDTEEEVLGIDSSFQLGSRVTVHGLSAYNVDDEDWQEHSYDLEARLSTFRLRPHLQMFDYGAYFDTGVNTGGPFRFLKDSDEKVTVLGADLGWIPTPRVELEFKGKHYNYDERDDNAMYYAALLALHGKKNPLSQVGAEIGLMDGDTDDTQYSLWRAYFYWDLPKFYVSGDGVFVDYKEDILGEDQSLFFSLAAGHWFLGDTLELRVSGDYSSDPYFDRDWRALAAVRYLFDK